MQPLWRIELFGGLRARCETEVVTRFRTQKTAALLAYLALKPGPQPREVLVGLLWPDSEPEAARNSLSAALSSLRRQLEANLPAGSLLIADRASAGLNATSFTTDVAEFESNLKQAEKADDTTRTELLAHAVEVYEGPLLPGFYDEWALSYTRQHEEEYFAALSDLLDLLDEAGQWERVVSYARRGVNLYPAQEEWHLALMRAYRALEQPEALLRQYEELKTTLGREGTEPSPLAQRLANEVKSQEKQSANESEEERAPLAEPESTYTSATPASPTPAELERTPEVVAGGVETALSPAPPTVWVPPSGVVAFLMTDQLEGEREVSLMAHEYERYEGHLLREASDRALWVFALASDALFATIAVQMGLTRLAQESRPRMALCAGEVQQVKGDYFGETLERVRRLLPAAHPGQILCDETTADLARHTATISRRAGTLLGPSEVSLRELGSYRLMDSGAERLFQVDYPGAPQFAPPRLASATNSQLPAQFTRFFGRHSEIEQLHRLLMQDGVRLVTLTGPGGSGKTRLMVETARGLAGHWRDAIWFVPLADISNAAFIFSAIRDALKLPTTPNVSPQDQLIEALAAQPTLLLLDNFEQLVEEGADCVQELLERLPALTILITSRQVLSLPAEREFPVLPLPVPEEETSVAQLKEYSSAAMFIDRAQAARVDFRVDERNAAAVAGICRRLDGIPLALELAAARSLVLSPTQMLEKLRGPLDILSTRQRGIPERHRTLRAAIEWSYGLLSPELQRFFARLSVFRGGWTIEAAEAVCEELEALDFLTRLRECSLVVTEERAEETRFRMLETLREYATTQLQDGERAARERHYTEYFLQLAEDAEPHLRGPEQAIWLERLEAEQDNFRAVLAWAMQNDATQALRLAAALSPFWETRGHYSEGRSWLERALAATTS